MADTFTSGTAGRVRVASNVTVAGITRWTMGKTFNVVRIPHFESTADADGTIHPNHLKGLAGPHTGTLEGYYNSDSTNQTDGAAIGISVGLSVVLDLIIVRGTPLGYSNVAATITRFNVEVAVENQPAKFTAEYEVNGDPGKVTTVT